jgi:septum formation protein
VPSEVPEQPLERESALAYVRRLSAAKAEDIAQHLRSSGDQRPVLGADTTVVIEEDVLGKPADRADARATLQRLSGSTHRVITGFCVVDSAGVRHRDEVTTEVLFKKLLPEEIEAYLDAGEWHDKAGGYGVQGRAAYFVRSVIGSYTNVVGLPLCEAVEALRACGVRPVRSRGETG